jgi:cell division protein FtsL
MTARPLRQSRPAGRVFRVIPGARRRGPVITPWAAFSVVVVVALFGIVVARTTLDQGAFELAELNRSIAEAEVFNQRLRLEIARLESPARVAPAAEALGLVYPTERAVLAVTGILAQSSDPDPRWATLDRYAAESIEVTP